jgi:hypothetical protein
VHTAFGTLLQQTYMTHSYPLTHRKEWNNLTWYTTNTIAYDHRIKRSMFTGEYPRLLKRPYNRTLKQTSFTSLITPLFSGWPKWFSIYLNTIQSTWRQRKEVSPKVWHKQSLLQQTIWWMTSFPSLSLARYWQRWHLPRNFASPTPRPTPYPPANYQTLPNIVMCHSTP